jgi:hypothetical protein
MPKLAILGTGWGVRVQANAFRAAGWELHAIWGRDPAKAEAALNWLRTTPPLEHREQTLAALECGVRPDQGSSFEDGLKVQVLMDEARRLAGWSPA